MKIQNKKKLIKKMINIYKKIWLIKIYLIDEYKQKKTNNFSEQNMKLFI